MTTLDLVWGLLWLSCTAALQVQIHPTRGDFVIGQSMLFRCQVVGAANVIDWYDPRGEKILPGNPNVIVSRNDDFTSTLIVVQAAAENAGSFKCVARAAEREAQAVVHLQQIHGIVFRNAPSPQEFNEGDDADVVCDVFSSPPPQIVWRKDRRVLRDERFQVQENGHLMIRDVQKADEGEYQCEALVLSLGELSTKSISVVVNQAALALPSSPDVQQVEPFSRSAVVKFKKPNASEAILKYGVMWRLKGPGSMWETLEYKASEELTQITIAGLEPETSYEVRVFAVNNVGRGESRTMSFTTTSEQLPSSPEIQQVAPFSCAAVVKFNRSDPSVLKYKVMWHTVPGGEWLVAEHGASDELTQIAITGLEPETSYEVQMLAVNNVGVSERSSPVSFTTKREQAPQIQGQSKVYTWMGRPANISCEVEALPSPQIVWFKDAHRLSNSKNVKIYNMETVSHLEINPETESDFGRYTCEATNSRGSGSRAFVLVQTEVPSSPEIQQVEPSPDSAVVTFNKPYSSGAVLKYTVLWRRRVPGSEWTSAEYTASDDLTEIVLTRLEPETSYEVQMFAANDKGRGDGSRPLTFTTKRQSEEQTGPSSP